MNAHYGEFERTPQRMLQQIAAAGGGLAPRTAAPSPPVAAPPIGAPGAIAQVGYEAPTSNLPIAGQTNSNKAAAVDLLRRAHTAIGARDYDAAMRLAKQASDLQVPDSAFGPGEPKPREVLRHIGAAQAANPVRLAGGGLPPRNGAFQPQVQQGLYNPAADTTQVIPAQAQAPLPVPPAPSPLSDPPPTQSLPPVPGVNPQPSSVPQVNSIAPTLPNLGRPTPTQAPLPTQAPSTQAAPAPGYVMSEGERLYRLGLDALQKYDRETAMKHFRAAWKHEAELDPAIRSQLKDKLSYLHAAAPPAALPAQNGQNLESLASEQQVALQELQIRMSTEMRAARQQLKDDPISALNRLQRLRGEVQQAQMPPSSLKQMLTLIDRQTAETQQYIDQNRPAIEAEQRNAEVRQSIAADRDRLSQVNNQVAQLVDDFNKLLDEQRFAEAEVVARQAYELAPDLPVVENMRWQSRFARQMAANLDLRERKERGFLMALESVEESSEPYDDRYPIDYGSPRRWSEMTRRRRAKYAEGEQRRMSDSEREIHRNLSNKVEVSFSEAPLSEVLKVLGKAANVPIYLDEQALRLAIVATDEPVTININQPIMLKKRVESDSRSAQVELRDRE